MSRFQTRRHPCHRPQRRATVLILVVAVLALLAVMGTVYIVAARAERTNAAALSTSANLNLARTAVLEMVRRAIGESMYDSGGNVGGYASTGSAYGNNAARNFDYPEKGATFGQTNYNPQMRDEQWLCRRLHCRGATSVTAGFNSAYPPSPDALAATINGKTDYDDFPSGLGDYSLLTRYFFDPLTGQFDINKPGSAVPALYRSADAAPSNNGISVVADDTPEVGNGTPLAGYTNSPSAQPSQAFALPGSLATTTNDALNDDPAHPELNYNATKTNPALGTGLYMPCPNNMFPDAYVQLLPYSDASGIRYQFGIRIIDTNRMANLNVSSTEEAAAASQDLTGSYITSLRLAGFAFANWQGNPAYYTNDYFDYGHDTSAAVLHSGTMGRSPGGTFTPLTWQQTVFQMDNFNSPPGAAFFDLSDELGLRAYGEFGTAYHVRPALVDSATRMWPFTLGVDNALNTTLSKAYPALTGAVPATPSRTVTGNPRRKNYTTYSWSREIRPYPNPAATPIYTLAPGATTGLPCASNWVGFGSTSTIWPTAPARLSANPNIPAGGDTDKVFYIAMAATNIATAMEDSGYSKPEARAFAINYITCRTDIWQKDANNAYYLPNGPSFMDSAGIWVRSATVNGSYAGLNALDGSGDSNKIYLGYSAQPFINEVAADQTMKPDPNDPNKPPRNLLVVQDSAVELYNPYSVPLSLNGYQLLVTSTDFVSGATTTTAIDLSGNFVPATGYFVIYAGTGDIPGNLPTPTATTVQALASNSLAFGTAGGTVTLYRSYTDPKGKTSYAPVDHLDYTTLMPTDQPTISTLTAPHHDYSLERKSAASAWACAFNEVSARVNSTLGLVNSTGGFTNVPPLYDRSFDQNLNGAAPVMAPFVNIAAFNRVMRLGHQFDSTAQNTTYPDMYTLVSCLTDRLDSAWKTPPLPYSSFTRFTNEPYESQLHFNFYADPSVYNTSPPSDNGSHQSDLCAVKLLDHLAFIDRVSDPTINLTGAASGATDINKIRLPGQINVNTASGDVLRALPAIQNAPARPFGTATWPSSDLLVANILAYRARADNGVPLDANLPFNLYKSNAAQYWGENSVWQYPTFPAGAGHAAWYNDGNPVATKKNVNSTNFTALPGKGIRSLGELLVPIYDALYVNSAGGVTPLAPPTSLDQRDQVWANMYNLCTVRSDTFIVYGYIQAVRQLPGYTGTFDNSAMWYESDALSDSPQSRSNSSTGLHLLQIANRRFIAIIDRSFCNYSRTNPDFALPRIVAVQDLPY